MYLFTSTTALFVWLGCMVKHRRLNFWFCAISITSTRTHVFKVFQCCLAGRKYFLSVLADKKKHYFPIFWESLEQPNAQLHMLVMLFFLHILIKSHNAQCSNSRVKSKQTQLEHFPSHCKKNEERIFLWIVSNRFLDDFPILVVCWKSNDTAVNEQKWWTL